MKVGDIFKNHRELLLSDNIPVGNTFTLIRIDSKTKIHFIKPYDINYYVAGNIHVCIIGNKYDGISGEIFENIRSSIPKSDIIQYFETKPGRIRRIAKVFV